MSKIMCYGCGLCEWEVGDVCPVEKMRKACEEKKRKTKGKCEDWECLGIEWCDDCLKAAKKEAKK